MAVLRAVYTIQTGGSALSILLKALLPVCMVYTARGESQVARGKAPVLYLSRDSHQELYIPYKGSGSALSVLLYFALTKC